MLVVQIAAGVVLGVLVLAWLEKRARHAAEERWRAAQGRISRREAILHPMVTEVYNCFSRESSAYHGYGEWPVPAEELPGLSDEEAIAKAHVLFSERSTNSKASSCGSQRGPSSCHPLSPSHATG